MSHTAVVANTVRCLCIGKNKKTVVLYSPWHELEFLNSAFLTFVGTLLCVWLHLSLCVALVMCIILLRVAVGRLASAAPVAIESGYWRKSDQRELMLQTVENMPCEINFVHTLGCFFSIL